MGGPEMFRYEAREERWFEGGVKEAVFVLNWKDLHWTEKAKHPLAAFYSAALGPLPRTASQAFTPNSTVTQRVHIPLVAQTMNNDHHHQQPEVNQHSPGPRVSHLVT